MIKLISAYTSNLADLAEISLPTFEEYCKYFGYDYDFTIIPSNYNKPPSWFKIEKFIDNFKYDCYTHVLWIDIDAIIINALFRLDSVIQNNKFLYLAKDFNNINCGVILAANNVYMYDFFRYVSEQTQYLNHIWWEQAAIIDMVANNIMNIKDYICYMPQNIWNAYNYSLYGYSNHPGSVNRDSFIYHVPGIDHSSKLLQLKKYYELRTY